jgi:aminocarboxymuconate-semialdehyde decarboxylase
MAVIDMHAHVTPERYKRAIREEGSWYGLDAVPGELGLGKFDAPLSERLADMDALGVDMQLVTPTIGFYQYANDLDTTRLIARECNAEVAEMVDGHPERFAGLATLPMQDPGSAIAELERVMGDLGLRGAVIGDHVAGRNYDEPEFLPFFKAAEDLGAILFFHQGGGTCVTHRIGRYKLGNAIGNPGDRTLLYATLVFGGVLDACPGLRPLLAHAGGYTAFGVARMDKVAGAMDPRDVDGALVPPFGRGPEDAHVLRRPPSDYLERFHYDCITYSEPALRFLIDAVGIDRVVLGTDYPAPMFLDGAVDWIMGLESLDAAEKSAILSGNADALLSA